MYCVICSPVIEYWSLLNKTEKGGAVKVFHRVRLAFLNKSLYIIIIILSSLLLERIPNKTEHAQQEKTNRFLMAPMGVLAPGSALA